MTSDISYKVNVPGLTVLLWAMQCTTITLQDKLTLTSCLYICLPLCFSISLHVQQTKKKEKRESLFPPEAISQNTLSSSSSYQQTKPWRSYVTSEKQKQGGGLLSCVTGWAHWEGCWVTLSLPLINTVAFLFLSWLYRGQPLHFCLSISLSFSIFSDESQAQSLFGDSVREEGEALAVLIGIFLTGISLKSPLRANTNQDMLVYCISMDLYNPWLAVE